MRRALFLTMQKTSNVALPKGKALLNYWWKLWPLNGHLVSVSFKVLQARELLLPSELSLCFQWAVSGSPKRCCDLLQWNDPGQYKPKSSVTLQRHRVIRPQPPPSLPMAGATRWGQHGQRVGLWAELGGARQLFGGPVSPEQDFWCSRTHSPSRKRSYLPRTDRAAAGRFCTRWTCPLSHARWLRQAQGWMLLSVGHCIMKCWWCTEQELPR